MSLILKVNFGYLTIFVEVVGGDTDNGKKRVCNKYVAIFGVLTDDFLPISHKNCQRTLISLCDKTIQFKLITNSTRRAFGGSCVKINFSLSLF